MILIPANCNNGHKRVFLLSYVVNPPLFPTALFLGGKEEAMPARPGHTHSEDLPWLEVPQPVPAAEKESDSGGSMVPPICGEAL